MEGKHTPGPWELGKLNSHCHAGTIPILTVAGKGTITGQKLVASVCGKAGEQETTATLIAAAPELLTALGLAVQALNAAPRFRVGDTDSYKIASIAEAAIAKAKGEGNETVPK